MARAVAETLMDAVKLRKPIPELNLVTLVQSTIQEPTEGDLHISPHDFDNVFQTSKKVAN